LSGSKTAARSAYSSVICADCPRKERREMHSRHFTFASSANRKINQHLRENITGIGAENNFAYLYNISNVFCAYLIQLGHKFLVLLTLNVEKPRERRERIFSIVCAFQKSNDNREFAVKVFTKPSNKLVSGV